MSDDTIGGLSAGDAINRMKDLADMLGARSLRVLVQVDQDRATAIEVRHASAFDVLSVPTDGDGWVTERTELTL